jgi:tetratricopeptide (TPR) repeat protein
MNDSSQQIRSERGCTMPLYRDDRMPGGSHYIRRTTWEDEAASQIVTGAASAAGWLIGAGISGTRSMIRNSQDRKLMRAAEELDAASDSADVGRFLLLSTEFTRRYPNESFGFEHHAMALMMNGRNPDAVAAADRAVQLGCDPVLGHIVRIKAFTDDGLTANALQACTAILQNPDPEVRSFGLTSRARLLMDLGDFDQALTDATQAVSQSPEAYTYCIRGHIYRAMGQPDKAIGDYSRAIQLDPQNRDVLESRAAVYEQLEQAEAAEADRAAVRKIDQQEADRTADQTPHAPATGQPATAAVSDKAAESVSRSLLSKWAIGLAIAAVIIFPLGLLLFLAALTLSLVALNQGEPLAKMALAAAGGSLVLLLIIFAAM